MEAIVGVWLTSILGAGAFSVAGYVLGQRGVGVPFLKLEPLPTQPPPPPAVPTPTPSMAPTPIPTETVVEPKSERPEAPTQQQPREASTPPAPPVRELKTPEAFPPEESATKKAFRDPRLEPDDDKERGKDTGDATNDGEGEGEGEGVERPTLVPARDVHAAAVAATAMATIPPSPRAPSMSASTRSIVAANTLEIERLREDVRNAQNRAEQMAQKARATEVVRSELERQIEVLRTELKHEVVARASAEKRCEELGDRLASASEEASSLRHRVSLLDKQSKQLREALQGRVRALTESELQRRRDLEGAEEIRAKLADVYDKLERSSLPPEERKSFPPPPATSALTGPPRAFASGASHQRVITASSPGMPAVPRSLRPAIDEAAALREEVTRLTAENRSLRARALGSLAPKASSRSSADSVPDLNLAVYREVVERVGGLAGMRGAAVTDEVGSLLLGAGEDAEGLAAFGAYIRDASARTDRLLPLDGVEEVDIRDRGGLLLSTRVVMHAPIELCVVLLGAEASLHMAKKVVEEGLQLR